MGSTVTADDLTVAFVDFALVLVSDAKGERYPIEYLHNRLLDMRVALSVDHGQAEVRQP